MLPEDSYRRHLEPRPRPWPAALAVGNGSQSESPVTTSGILADVWNALRASELAVLEAVTLADLAANRLPDSVQALLVTPEFTSPR